MPFEDSSDVKFEIRRSDVTCLEMDVIRRSNKLIEGNIMATKTKSTDSVYRVTEVIGTSAQSWENAAKNAVQTAAGTLRDLRIAEVVKLDVKVEDGKVLEFRTRLQLSFKYES
jgi:flavin-binding protein dodecin